MVEFDLNLSTKPFPAYRLANLAMVAILILLVAVSAWQGYSFVHYSALARGIRQEERDARVQSDALNVRLDDLTTTLNRPDAAAKLMEIDFLNGLLARERFSWTQLFADLEKRVPESVHLTSLRPDRSKDGVILHIDVSGHTIGDISEMIQRLQDSPAFGKVIVSEESKKAGPASGEVDVVLMVPYFSGKPAGAGK